MAVYTVTLDFSSDNGLAESFVDGTGQWPDGVYDGSEGNPSGSVNFSIAYPDTGGYVSASVTKTLEQWGVPRGATITNIDNLQGEVKITMGGAVNYAYPGVKIDKSGATIQYRYPASPVTTSIGWTTITPLQVNSDQSPYTLNTPITVSVLLYGTVPNSGDSLDYWYDNISFDVTYTPFDGLLLVDSSQGQASDTIQAFPDGIIPIDGVDSSQGQISDHGNAYPEGIVSLVPVDSSQGQQSDNAVIVQHNQLTLIDTSQAQTSGTLLLITVILSGGITQAAQIVGGGLSIDGEMILYGGITQGAQRVSGFMFIPLSGEAAAPEIAIMNFELLLDSIEYPMIRASVTRQIGREVCTVVVPSAVLPGILSAAPTTLAINVKRTVKGITTSQQLFTGALSLQDAKNSVNVASLPAIGAASYGTPTNRILAGKPLYTRESAFDSAVRGIINELLIPGDVLRYNTVRELYVNKVVFNVDGFYSFMEASNGW